MGPSQTPHGMSLWTKHSAREEKFLSTGFYALLLRGPSHGTWTSLEFKGEMDECQMGFCCSRHRKAWEQARGRCLGSAWGGDSRHLQGTWWSPCKTHHWICGQNQRTMRSGGSIMMHERGPISGLSRVQRRFSVASPSQISSLGIPPSRCCLWEVHYIPPLTSQMLEFHFPLPDGPLCRS